MSGQFFTRHFAVNGVYFGLSSGGLSNLPFFVTICDYLNYQFGLPGTALKSRPRFLF